MNAAGCLQILRQIREAAFATVDEAGCPQVRIIDVMAAEEEKLYFLTARGKNFYRELMNTKSAAVTAMTDKCEMVRLNGRVERLLEQKKWLGRMFKENPVMNELYPGESRFILEPFCISCAQIEFYDLSSVPVFRESYSIGGYRRKEKGYRIGRECIFCGRCAVECPQQCIIAGEPYVIRRENCLHCGLCFENCPTGAILALS